MTTNAKSRRIMIVAGEASGDLHGAEVARELRVLEPNCELVGIAGKHMRAAGVKALFRAEDITAVGFGELAGRLTRNVRAFLTLRQLINTDPPSLLVLIDFPDFNMRLAKVAKRRGVPVLYYIAPQVWAWRPKRAYTLAKTSDRIAVVFPFEVEIFAKTGASVEFVGHPLLDRVKPTLSREQTLAKLGLAPDSRLLALLPGSRGREVQYLLEPMLEAARALQRTYGLRFCLILAPTLTRYQLQKQSRVDLSDVPVVEEGAYDVLAASELAFVASGTATLEAALLGCPMVIVYKMSRLTYYVLRLMVRGVSFIGMPNILLRRRVVPELLQDRVKSVNLVRLAQDLLQPEKRAQISSALKEVRQMLGAPGAARRVAQMALAMATTS